MASRRAISRSRSCSRCCSVRPANSASNHPQVRFEADAATLDGDTLKARGLLHAAGKHIPLDVDAAITPAGDGFEIEAGALADHRELGMLWSPMGILRAPSKLIVRGRLVRADDAR